MAEKWKVTTVCMIGNHARCGGWYCVCDCHDDDQVDDTELVDHGEHDAEGWTQVGPCIYCSCGERFGQGELPPVKDRRAMATTNYEICQVSLRMLNEMVTERRRHKGLA